MKKLTPLLLVLTCACAHFDGFATLIGAEAVGIGALTVHYIKHPSHPRCTISRGPDTVVTVPTSARELEGQMWNGQCLTQDEVRRLRHE